MLQDRRSKLMERRAFLSVDDADRHPNPSPPAVRVGADLRAARERLGWNLEAVAAHLRIRQPYLEALEGGRIGELPGIAYALGFLRTYSQALGLDPDEMARRFRAEAAEANRKTELNFPAPVPTRGTPAGAVVLVGAILAIGGYIGWYRMSEAVRPAETMVQPVPAHLAPLAENATPPAPSAAPQVAAEVAKTETLHPEPPAPIPPLSPVSAAAAVPTPADQAAAPPLPMPQPQPTMAVAPPPAPATPAAMPDPAAGARIVLRAKADSWVQVRDKGGHVLLNRVLRNGETWPVPDRPALLLTTGNAGGTELLVDGQPTAALGSEGAVRRDLPLDAEAIKAGKLAPPSSKRS